MANLLYGAGLRLMEVLRLRVKDLDFGMPQITVRDDKGFKDRVTMLPASLIEPLQRYLEKVKEIHREDLRAGFGDVYLPYALERKYVNTGREWGLASMSFRLEPSGQPIASLPKSFAVTECPLRK